jgi:diaminopimelate epimerase
MQGAGNDYIYVNAEKYPLDNPEELSITWSAPHTGIGADGLVMIDKSDTADFSMRIFNADGSEALMCGNAVRCIGKYVYENRLTDKKSVTLDTLSGVKKLELTVESGTVTEVTVDMGAPLPASVGLNLDVAGRLYLGTEVSMGNPHFVIFVDDMSAIDIPTVGPALERHPHFPDRTNVEFVKVISPGEIRMRVWERGSGITMACGTGACASVAAGVKMRKTGRRVKVNMDGGELFVDWDETSGRIYMTGGAVKVFEGTIDI